MALVMVAVGACGLACWLAAVLLIPRLSARSSSAPASEARNPSREEDRVRPAVAATGERIWIDADELVWHEIVAWPQPRATERDVQRPA